MEGVLEDETEMGLIPRIVKDIFKHVNASENKFEIKVSHLEIYLKEIRDLLVDTQTKGLKVCEGKRGSPFVKGLTEVIVNNEDEMGAQLFKGSHNRKFACTRENDHSSRSHTIFQISVQQVIKESQKTIFGKLLLIDLAGSEKVNDSNLETCKEAKYIYTSLSAFTKVISSLAKRSRHIPFRDSLLTHLLKDCLGGNSQTTMIICASPASEAQLKSALEFGCQAQLIRNNSVVNEIQGNKWKILWEKANDELSTLKIGMKNAESEIKRWRIGETVPKEQWVPFYDHILDSCVSTTMDVSYSSVLNKSGNITASDNVIENVTGVNLEQEDVCVSEIQVDGVNDSITQNRCIENMEIEFKEKLLAMELKLKEKDKEIVDLTRQNNAYKAELEKLSVSKIQGTNVDNSITQNRINIENINVEFGEKFLTMESKLKEKEISDVKQQNVYEAELTIFESSKRALSISLDYYTRLYTLWKQEIENNYKLKSEVLGLQQYVRLISKDLQHEREDLSLKEVMLKYENGKLKEDEYHLQKENRKIKEQLAQLKRKYNERESID